MRSSPMAPCRDGDHRVEQRERHLRAGHVDPVVHAVGQIVDRGDLAALDAGEVAVDEADQLDSASATGVEHVLSVHAQPTIAASAHRDRPAPTSRRRQPRPSLARIDAHVTPTAGRLACFSDGVVASVRREFCRATSWSRRCELFRETNLGSHYLLHELARFPGRGGGVGDRRRPATRRRHRLSGLDRAPVRRRRHRRLLVDEGGAQPRITLDELGAIAPVRLRRVARSDNFIRDLLPDEDTGSASSSATRQALEAAIADGAIAFKSVIAYRTGLDVQPVRKPKRVELRGSRLARSAPRRHSAISCCATPWTSRANADCGSTSTPRSAIPTSSTRAPIQPCSTHCCTASASAQQSRRAGARRLAVGRRGGGDGRDPAQRVPGRLGGRLFGMPNMRQRSRSARGCPYSQDPVRRRRVGSRSALDRRATLQSTCSAACWRNWSTKASARSRRRHRRA